MGIFNASRNQSIAPLSQQTAISKKILIVEDETPLSDALDIKLRNSGFTVFKAGDGQEGFQEIMTNHSDLVLLDLTMPVMDGKEMLRRLRATPGFEKLPIIVLTNSGSIDNLEEETSELGVVNFLIKSDTPLDDILQEINELLEN